MSFVTSIEVYILALLSALLWGFNPILDKWGMNSGGNALQAALVVAVTDSFLFWLALLILNGTTLFSGLTLETLGIFVFSGVVATGFGRLAVFPGIDRLGASINNAGVSTRPLFATILALIWLGASISLQTAVGILVLVSGLILLTLSKGGDIRGWRSLDLLFPLGAAALFALGNVVRRYGLIQTPITPLEAATINETAGLVALAGYALGRGRWNVLSAPRQTYAYFAGSGLLTAGALLALLTALAAPAGRIVIVDPLAATAPLFTTLFAYLLLRDLERVTRGVVVGAALIVIGGAAITL